MVPGLETDLSMKRCRHEFPLNMLFEGAQRWRRADFEGTEEDGLERSKDLC